MGVGNEIILTIAPSFLAPYPTHSFCSILLIVNVCRLFKSISKSLVHWDLVLKTRPLSSQSRLKQSTAERTYWRSPLKPSPVKVQALIHLFPRGETHPPYLPRMSRWSWAETLLQMLSSDFKSICCPALPCPADWYELHVHSICLDRQGYHFKTAGSFPCNYRREVSLWAESCFHDMLSFKANKSHETFLPQYNPTTVPLPLPLLHLPSLPRSSHRRRLLKFFYSFTFCLL